MSDACLKDIIQCSQYNKQIHYYRNGLSEASFRKTTKTTKARIICFTCPIPKITKTTIETNGKLKKKIEDLIKWVSFRSEKFDSFEIKINSMFVDIKMIKNENNQIKLENIKLTKEMNKMK